MFRPKVDRDQDNDEQGEDPDPETPRRCERPQLPYGFGRPKLDPPHVHERAAPKQHCRQTECNRCQDEEEWASHTRRHVRGCSVSASNVNTVYTSTKRNKLPNENPARFSTR